MLEINLHLSRFHYWHSSGYFFFVSQYRLLSTLLFIILFCLAHRLLAVGWYFYLKKKRMVIHPNIPSFLYFLPSVNVTGSMKLLPDLDRNEILFQCFVKSFHWVLISVFYLIRNQISRYMMMPFFLRLAKTKWMSTIGWLDLMAYQPLLVI